MGAFPGFVGPTYKSQARNAAAERCINFYPELLETTSPKARSILLPTPGFAEFSTPSAALKPRAAIAKDDRCFVILGHVLYEQLGNGTLIERGTVITDDNPAQIAHSGDGGQQLAIASGGGIYCYDLTTNTLTGPIAGLVGHFVGYLGGRFITLDTSTSTVRISNVYNGLIWNILQARQRTLAGDKWKSMVVTKDRIWLFGSQTYEVWYNSGAFPFPFEPVPGAVFTEGIGPPFSAVDIGEAVAWVTANKDGQGQIVMSSQYAPEVISNHSVSNSLQQGQPIDDCVGITYQGDNHLFLIFKFPHTRQGWAFDLTTKLWHERLTWVNDGYGAARWEAWAPSYHVSAFNKHLVWHGTTGVGYEMSKHQYYDVGETALRRMRVMPHLSAENRLIRYAYLEVEMDVGVGLQTGQGSNPQAMLRYSNDGGITYGNEHWTTLGAVGKYKTRVSWERLGQSRNRVFELSFSDPVPVRLINAYLGMR